MGEFQSRFPPHLREGRGVSDQYGVRNAACPLSTRGGGGLLHEARLRDGFERPPLTPRRPPRRRCAPSSRRSTRRCSLSSPRGAATKRSPRPACRRCRRALTHPPGAARAQIFNSFERMLLRANALSVDAARERCPLPHGLAEPAGRSQTRCCRRAAGGARCCARARSARSSACRSSRRAARSPFQLSRSLNHPGACAPAEARRCGLCPLDPRAAPRPSPRTNRTCRVPHPVLIGHA